MHFHLLSDLHLEFHNFELIKPDNTDILILTGDIGSPLNLDYINFINKSAELYKLVFIIKGNHECYDLTIHDTSEKIRNICNKYNNVIYLDNQTFDINNNIRILGTTLWSNIKDNEKINIATSIADFKRILDWSIEKHNYNHIQSITYIKYEIEKAKKENKRLIIISHHAPYLINTSHNEHRGSMLTSAFATDLSKLISSPIVAWCYGHTHYSNRQKVNGVLLLSNQKGYNYEKTNFNPLFTFEII